MNSVMERRMAAAEREYENTLVRTIELMKDFTVQGYSVIKTHRGLGYQGFIHYNGEKVGRFEKIDDLTPTHISIFYRDSAAKAAWDMIKAEVNQTNSEILIDALLTKEGY